ncbi:MAG TPA: hypothetical protein VFA04_23605 [Bryobacteraceae bacterium]|nr:hypothetical protein [Bryobacteraceae bacterium]
MSLLAVFATCGIAIAASPTVTLPEGTELRLKFAQELSSKTAALDDPVEFVLDDDVKVGDVVVIKAGAKAFGTVSNVKRAGFMGKGGELNVRLETIKAGGTKVRIRGTKGRTGEDKTGSAIALTVLLGPVGLIKHGKEIEVKEGTPITAFVADDIALPPAN